MLFGGYYLHILLLQIRGEQQTNKTEIKGKNFQKMYNVSTTAAMLPFLQYAIRRYQ